MRSSASWPGWAWAGRRRRRRDAACGCHRRPGGDRRADRCRDARRAGSALREHLPGGGAARPCPAGRRTGCCPGAGPRGGARHHREGHRYHRDGERDAAGWRQRPRQPAAGAPALVRELPAPELRAGVPELPDAWSAPGRLRRSGLPVPGLRPQGSPVRLGPPAPPGPPELEPEPERRVPQRSRRVLPGRPGGALVPVLTDPARGAPGLREPGLPHRWLKPFPSGGARPGPQSSTRPTGRIPPCRSGFAEVPCFRVRAPLRARRRGPWPLLSFRSTQARRPLVLNSAHFEIFIEWS